MGQACHSSPTVRRRRRSSLSRPAATTPVELVETSGGLDKLDRRVDRAAAVRTVRTFVGSASQLVEDDVGGVGRGGKALDPDPGGHTALGLPALEEVAQRGDARADPLVTAYDDRGARGGEPADRLLAGVDAAQALGH